MTSLNKDDQVPELGDEWLSEKDLNDRRRRQQQYKRNQMIQTTVQQKKSNKRVVMRKFLCQCKKTIIATMTMTMMEIIGSQERTLIDGSQTDNIMVMNSR